MRKIATFAIVSMAGCVLSPVMAQSNVTLYGIMDTGVARIDNVNGSNVNLVRSGNLLPSRFGFRGTEDLGGGLKAVFNLEACLSSDTGATNTPFFNCQSWVGLRSDNLGEVEMGRMLPTISDVFVASRNAHWLGSSTAALDGAGVGAGSSAARFNNMIGGTRVDNAIKYQTPSMSGFKVHAMTAFGEVAGASSAGRILSLAGSYASKSMEAGLVYHERNCAEAGGCAAGKDKDQILGVGGAYLVNGARYGTFYTRQKNALNVRGNDADVLSLLARVPLNGTPWVLGGGFQFLNDKTALNQDVRQFNLAINYLLSKRTQLYTLYSHQTVKNGGKAGMYSTTSSNDKQNQLGIGIAHAF